MQKKVNNLLEVGSFVNLCILSASMYHVKITGGNQAKVAYASVGIAFVTFTCVVIHKLYLLILKRFELHELKKYIVKVLRGNRETGENEETELNVKVQEQSVKPTTTIVGLCEPLLDH